MDLGDLLGVHMLSRKVSETGLFPPSDVSITNGIWTLWACLEWRRRQSC